MAPSLTPTQLDTLAKRLEDLVTTAITSGQSRQATLDQITDIAAREYDGMASAVWRSAAETYLGDDADWCARLARQKAMAS